jgi:hypothetical protein
MGHYLIEQNYLSFSNDVPDEIRINLLQSCDLTCGMCGIGPGEFDSDTGVRATLWVEPSRGDSLVQASCSICIEGRREAGLV